jgi:hypothetical protein
MEDVLIGRYRLAAAKLPYYATIEVDPTLWTYSDAVRRT